VILGIKPMLTRKFFGFVYHTCTIAMCNRTPLSPTTIDETAITAGPVRKRTAIANEATVFPQAIILGCNAMNNPTNSTGKNQIFNHLTHK
jgi:hypothetical protein